jgi:hypothetical protein
LRKLQQALIYRRHTKRRGYLKNGAERDLPSAPVVVPKSERPWPRPDHDAIDRIVTRGPGLYGLWEQSPVRFDDEEEHAEDIIDTLFPVVSPDDPLLCCGESSSVFATRPREDWRGLLADLSLICPNPMLSMKGITKDGHESEHALSATCRSVYQVIEFDFSAVDKVGACTQWAPLINKWEGAGITIADACASLLLQLRGMQNTLACVCSSGGKSLHGWFRVFELDPDAHRGFMRRAVALGADKATWTRHQFVRIPDGQRENGRRQTCYYVDPERAIKV